MFISCVASSVVTAASKFCLKIGLGRERIVRLGAKTNRKDIPDSWLLVFLSTQNPGLPAHIRRCNRLFFFSFIADLSDATYPPSDDRSPTSNELSYPEALYVGPGGDWFASEAVL